MASHAWTALEKPLNSTILSVIENEYKFEKMTPVQVSDLNQLHRNFLKIFFFSKFIV